MRGLALAVGSALLLAAGAVGAAHEHKAEPVARAAAPAKALARAITPRHLRAHLTALETIARRNGGTRAAGTPGYRSPWPMVTRQLRAAGYRPRLHAFSFDYFRETATPVLEASRPGPEATGARAGTS